MRPSPWRGPLRPGHPIPRMPGTATRQFQLQQNHKHRARRRPQLPDQLVTATGAGPRASSTFARTLSASAFQLQVCAYGAPPSCRSPAPLHARLRRCRAQARDDAQPRFTEFARQHPGQPAPQRRGVARPDNGDHLLLEQMRMTQHGDDRRRRLQRRQSMRKIRLAGNDKAAADFLQRSELARDLVFRRQDEFALAPAPPVSARRQAPLPPNRSARSGSQR